jgi:hypothetical protein
MFENALNIVENYPSKELDALALLESDIAPAVIGTMPMLGGKDQVGTRTYLDSGVVNELHELEH